MPIEYVSDSEITLLNYFAFKFWLFDKIGLDKTKDDTIDNKKLNWENVTCEIDVIRSAREATYHSVGVNGTKKKKQKTQSDASVTR